MQYLPHDPQHPVTQFNQTAPCRHQPVDEPIHFGPVGGLHRFSDDVDASCDFPALVREHAALVERLGEFVRNYRPGQRVSR